MSNPLSAALVGKMFSGIHATVTGFTGGDVAEVKRIGLRFRDDESVGGAHIGATAGCNTMGANFTWVGTTLKAEHLMSTLMMGPESIMNQERWLSELLTSAPTVRQRNGELVITGEVGTLVLAEVVSPPLQGTEWVATGTLTPNAFSSLPDGAVVSILIEDVAARVWLGCNSGSANIIVSSDGSDDTGGVGRVGGVGRTGGAGRIHFAGVRTTRMMCDELAMELERHMLKVYAGEVTFVIDDETLTLTNPDGMGARFAPLQRETYP